MVTKLLEKAIEIEGLLRIIRDGNPLPETFRLLQQKASELAEGSVSLEYKAGGNFEYKGENSAPENTQPDIVMAVPAKTSETTEVVFSETYTEKGAEDELELSEEDDIILTFEEEAGDQRPEVRDQRPEAGDQSPEIRVQRPGAGDQRPEAGDQRQEVRGQRPKREVKLKSAFSLNDRFLYARELFGGNMKMFDSALEFIEGVDDYALIEEYFFNELGWDPENANVGAFMETIRKQY